MGFTALLFGIATLATTFASVSQNHYGCDSWHPQKTCLEMNLNISMALNLDYVSCSTVLNAELFPSTPGAVVTSFPVLRSAAYDCVMLQAFNYQCQPSNVIINFAYGMVVEYNCNDQRISLQCHDDSTNILKISCDVNSARTTNNVNTAVVVPMFHILVANSEAGMLLATCSYDNPSKYGYWMVYSGDATLAMSELRCNTLKEVLMAGLTLTAKQVLELATYCNDYF